MILGKNSLKNTELKNDEHGFILIFCKHIKKIPLLRLDSPKELVSCCNRQCITVSSTPYILFTKDRVSINSLQTPWWNSCYCHPTLHTENGREKWYPEFHQAFTVEMDNSNPLTSCFVLFQQIFFHLRSRNNTEFRLRQPTKPFQSEMALQEQCYNTLTQRLNGLKAPAFEIRLQLEYFTTRGQCNVTSWNTAFGRRDSWLQSCLEIWQPQHRGLCAVKRGGDKLQHMTDLLGHR